VGATRQLHAHHAILVHIAKVLAMLSQLDLAIQATFVMARPQPLYNTKRHPDILASKDPAAKRHALWAHTKTGIHSVAAKSVQRDISVMELQWLHMKEIRVFLVAFVLKVLAQVYHFVL